MKFGCIDGIEVCCIVGKRVQNKPPKEYPYKYFARHSDMNSNDPCTIEENKVIVNFWGTVFAKERFKVKDSFHDIQKIKWYTEETCR